MNSIPEGDEYEQVTFSAVGQALTAWERCEDSLSTLYTILDNAPGELEKFMEYGREGKSLQYRLECVRKKGELFFVKSPNQQHEGELAEIIQVFLTSSPLRHQIAHGIVQPLAHCGPSEDGLHKPSTTRYYLCAPWFAEERLQTGLGYGSAEILTIALGFERLEGRIITLASALF